MVSLEKCHEQNRIQNHNQKKAHPQQKTSANQTLEKDEG